MNENPILPALPDSLTADYERERARAYYDQLRLEQWSRRPIRRRSHAEQAARTTWRYLQYLIAGVLALSILSAWAIAIKRPEHQTVCAAFRQLALLGELVPLSNLSHTPDWWVRLNIGGYFL